MSNDKFDRNFMCQFVCICIYSNLSRERLFDVFII